MLYLCDTCNRVYKYRKNLLRHIREKHDPSHESFQCVEDGCERKFIRREYMYIHLQRSHGYEKADAIRTVLKVSTDKEENDDEFEDVFDDDNVFELMDELEKIKESTTLQEKAFDIDEYLSDISDAAENEMKPDHDVNNNMNIPDANDQQTSDIETIEISDDDDVNEYNDTTTLDHSTLRTRTQTLTYTSERKIYYVDGFETSTETMCYQDYYELFE